MFKKGFTLAEVLITLMIIGVVATLTTPALVKNVGSSKIGPQLSKFVNTFETAAEALMMDENISDLSEGHASVKASAMDRLSKYMIMTKLKDGSINFNKGDGSDYYIESFSAGHTWQLKDGTIMVFDPAETSDVDNFYYEGSGAYTEDALQTSILVDIGGLKGSHRAGKEVFAFMVDNKGLLVPYGSNTHRSMNKNMKAVCNASSSDISNNLACTGEAADNGWKATW